jgi:hypothetical protein
MHPLHEKADKLSSEAAVGQRHFRNKAIAATARVSGKVLFEQEGAEEAEFPFPLSVLSAPSCSNSELHSPSPFAFFGDVVLVLLVNRVSKVRTDTNGA